VFNVDEIDTWSGKDFEARLPRGNEFAGKKMSNSQT